jgi:hypothetical protein
MVPVLGPPTPQTVTANHPAILVGQRLTILDDGRDGAVHTAGPAT